MLIEAARRQEPPPPPPPPPAPPPARHVDHAVQAGETLTEISNRYQTTPAQLTDANPQIADANQLQVGQIVRVPIGEGYGSEPIAVRAKPGDTLTALAAQYRQPVDDIVGSNLHTLSDPDHIEVGQQIWIPGGYTVPPTAPAPAPQLTPIEQKAQATDAAARRVSAAQSTYDDVAASTNGSGAALPYLAQNLADAKTALRVALTAEIDARVQAQLPPGQLASEVHYEAAATAVTQRQQANPAATQAVAEALAQSTTVRQTASIVGAMQTKPDPKEALQLLNSAYAKASPAVQQALLLDPQVRAAIDAGVTWALEPLGLDPLKQWSPQTPGFEAAQRLDQLSAGLNPEIAARVMAAATPRIESATLDFDSKYGGTPFGQSGVMHLVTALGRTAGTPIGDASIERIAKLGIWDSSGVVSAIAQGANPAYAIAFARQPGMDATIVMDAALQGMQIFRENIGDHTTEYGKHMEELAWLVKSHGGSMTPEQLDKAIADYTAEKGPEWQARTEELRKRLADDGARLLEQIAALQNLPGELASQQGAVDHVLEETLSDPKAHLAMSTALQTKPELTQGVAGERLLGVFTSTGLASNAKITDQVRKLAIEVSTAYIKSNVVAGIGEFDPANPASVQRAHDAIESLRNSRLAQALGVSEDALDKAVSALRSTMPVAGESAEETAKRLSAFNDTLGDLKGFDKTSLPGQLLRGVGLGLAGVGLLASIERAGLDPSLRNDLRVLVDSAGLGQKGAELLAGLTKADDASTLGKLGGSAASKFLGVLTAALDIWSSADAFGKGDIPSGILFGVGAGGGLLAAFGSGSIAGPIGIGLVVVSVLGLAVWNGIKEANKHEFDNDGGTSMRFLLHAGFSQAAAHALVDQSGDGHSPVPILARYAELKGLNLEDPAQRQTFVDWINTMQPEQFEVLRDNLHHTLDDIDGDVSRFHATADDDAIVVPDTQSRPHFAAFGDATPRSAAQLDAVLGVLSIPVLQP